MISHLNSHQSCHNGTLKSILQLTLHKFSVLMGSLSTIFESNSWEKTEIDQNYSMEMCANYDAFVRPQGDQMITHNKELD